MSNIDIEKALYRIIQGRLRYKVRDGLVLYIHEPTPEIIYESYDIYDEAYEKAYWRGVYVKEEVLPILLENNYWSPLDDKEAERVQKQIEDKKLEAFKQFIHKKQLGGIKREIFYLEKKWQALYLKKNSLDHVTCAGCAELTRNQWLIEKTTKFSDGSFYDWKEASIPSATNYRASNAISQEMYRSVARSDTWRGMWGAGKGTEIFGVPFSRITQEQARLCMYARMYDNVAESPEAPIEEIIADDICLDGWFIDQKKKQDKQKKQNQVDGMISNDKIKNSGEVFVMAQGGDDAKEIYDLNDGMARSTVKQRQAQIEGKEDMMNFKELADVKQDIGIQRQQQFSQSLKNKG
jgi:hypothetical protein